MKQIDNFYLTERRWKITYTDGTIIETEESPIKCEYIGESMTLSPLDESPNEHCYESWWHFKNGLCPFRLNGKWGFVDNNLSVIIQPSYDFVGEVFSRKCACWRPMEFIHSVQWTDGLCGVKVDGKHKMINEKGFLITEYELRIRQIERLTINDIINISRQYVPDYYKSCPWAYRDDKGRTLNHGTAVLETEEQCCAYIAAYGAAHWHKLIYAFSEEMRFPYDYLKKGVEIYDWGCGQGIGTVALVERLREKGLVSAIKKITLEEPSPIARSRAVLHVKQALNDNNVKIVEVPDFLPSTSGDDSNSILSINVEQPCAVHIFSNILDIETVSLKGVAQLIASSGMRHIVLCIGPANLNENRISSFKNYFRNESLNVFSSYHNTNFGRHPNGKAYGCLINSFTYKLSDARSVLHEYKYFAPIQLFASYSETIKRCENEKFAFEVLAPFDMTAHKVICPVYALISNLISRGCPTFASQNVIDSLVTYTEEKRQIALQAIARIQKTLIEALISDRLSILKEEWKILIIEDGTDVAKLALDDFGELYSHLIAMTVDYNHVSLPKLDVYTNKTADIKKEYDIVIDVSIEKQCNPEAVVFSKYKVKNDCYFIVRSSKSVYEDRILYTTERIKYKPFIEKDNQGIYIENREQTDHLRYFLNLIFRKEDFRPGQLPILNRALQLKSVIGLLPTGGGKSLTYQLAAMLQPAITLVVDPLKGLMKDQYDGLLRIGIDCISYINNDVKDKTVREQMLTSSKIQIMFLSPERLCIHRFREVLRSMRESNVYFAYGVIDEVHCVSEWGHDFRLSYLHLGRNLFNYVLPKEVEGEDNHISLFGLTATASFDVLADVERELSGRKSFPLEDDATIRYENTNRLELQYNVVNIDASKAATEWAVGDIKENELLTVINDSTFKIEEVQNTENIDRIKKRFLERENISEQEKIDEIYGTDLDIPVEYEWYTKSNTKSAGIVFCPRAGDSDKEIVASLSVVSLANVFLGKGILNFSTYKGGEDTSSQDDFLMGKTSIMVSTKAFGMGIDKPNVRLTFHLNYPGSLESFVQEAGRAGRDKKMALATILYSPKKFGTQNVRTRLYEYFSADYITNKYFYDSNFLGEEFELYMMEQLMVTLPVKISNEEFHGSDTKKSDDKGIIKYLKTSKYKNKTLTYYMSYDISDAELGNYNSELRTRNLPIFETQAEKELRRRKGKKYAFGYAQFKDSLQKAIYRMCVIGLIDDFTEDYVKKTFRITTVCQDESNYYDNLKSYYRKYYSEERASSMIEEVKQRAKTEGVIMACLKHLTSFVYKSIAEKRARGILDMEQFCNQAITSGKDWKETNEDLKDFIYYYFNSKYAREGFVTRDSIAQADIPFSLKDDTNHDIHTEEEITSFELAKKYMRVVDSEIVNNDSQTDNVKHLQGAVRLIRRAVAGINPVLNLLNVFCIFFLRQEKNEMLEEELYNDYKAVLMLYSETGKLHLLEDYTKLLVQHTAISEKDREYIKKMQYAIQLEEHAKRINEITNKYIQS